MSLWSIHDILPPFGTAPVAKPGEDRTALLRRVFERMEENPTKAFTSQGLKWASESAWKKRAFVREAISKGDIFTKPKP